MTSDKVKIGIAIGVVIVILITGIAGILLISNSSNQRITQEVVYQRQTQTT